MKTTYTCHSSVRVNYACIGVFQRERTWNIMSCNVVIEHPTMAFESFVMSTMYLHTLQYLLLVHQCANV